MLLEKVAARSHQSWRIQTRKWVRHLSHTCMITHTCHGPFFLFLVEVFTTPRHLLLSVLTENLDNNPSMLAMFSHGPIGRFVTDIALWNRPLTSALSLLSAILAWFLVQFGGYSITTLVSYVLLLQLLVCVVYVQWKGFYNSSASISSKDYEMFTEAQIRACVIPTLQQANAAARWVIWILRCRDNAITLLVAALLFGLSILGKVVPDGTCAIVIIAAFFTLPSLFLRVRSFCFSLGVSFR